MMIRSNGSNNFVKLFFAGCAVVLTTTLSQVKVAHRALSTADYHLDNPVAEIPSELQKRLIWDGSSVSAKTSKKTNANGTAFQANPDFSEQLMDEFVSGARAEAEERRRKRRKQDARKQEKTKHRRKKKQPIKVPTPIFVPSLPKSGTTTTHQYFQCGGYKSAHLAARTEDSLFKIGRCTQRNVMAGQDPFAGCGDYDVWTDTGYVAARYQADKRDLKKDNIQCYYPLIDALDEVYTSYPNATFLFVVRETEGWLNSIQSYHDGFIMDVWRRCKTRGFPGLDGTIDDFSEFYNWHKDMIRTFAQEHPSLTYIEVDLESAITGQILEEKVGIDASCWGHHNQQGKDSTPDITSSTNPLIESKE